jgi:hypothetical protein
MPGLLRGIARTAVVAGTATAVSGRVQRRQASRFGAPATPAAPPAPAYEQPATAQVPPPRAEPSRSDTLEQLKTLADLKAQGVLTDDEFAAEKAKILGG